MNIDKESRTYWICLWLTGATILVAALWPPAHQMPGLFITLIVVSMLGFVAGQQEGVRLERRFPTPKLITPNLFPELIEDVHHAEIQTTPNGS